MSDPEELLKLIDGHIDAMVKALESSRIKDVARQKESQERRKARLDAFFERMKTKKEKG